MQRKNMPSGRRIARVVLAGAGVMGKIRAEILSASTRYHLCGIIDNDYAEAKRLADHYSTEAFSTFDEVIARFRLRPSSNNEDSAEDNNGGSDNESLPSMASSTDFPSERSTGLDGIVICVPSALHGPYIKKAAQYGLAIFSEKPIALLPNEIEELYRICRFHGVPLCCGFQRRFDVNYVAAARAIQRGDIGKPLNAQVFFGDSPCPPLEFLLLGGNIFQDLSIHDVDYIRWALQDEVATVYATATCSSTVLQRHGIHDNAVLVMAFKRGCLVTLTLSRWSCYGYDQRCEVFGLDGMISVGNERQNTTVLHNENGEHHSKLKHSFKQRFQQAFSAEMEAFCDTVLSGAHWTVSEEDAITVQKIAQAAKESCKTGRVIILS